MLVLRKNVGEQSSPVQLLLWNFEGDATISAVDCVKDLDWIDGQIEVTTNDVTDAKSTDLNKHQHS